MASARWIPGGTTRKLKIYLGLPTPLLASMRVGEITSAGASGGAGRAGDWPPGAGLTGEVTGALPLETGGTDESGNRSAVSQLTSALVGSMTGAVISGAGAAEAGLQLPGVCHNLAFCL